MVPVSLSGRVEPGARTGTSVGGQAVVVWRGHDALARAWEDWCPHRGMRLSFGFVRGSRLTCIYHGWSFAGTGQCLAVPAHPGMTSACPASSRCPEFPSSTNRQMLTISLTINERESCSKRRSTR